MPPYRDAQTLYLCLGKLFDRVQREAPESTRALTGTGITIRFRFTSPEAEILFDARVLPFRYTYGRSDIRADLDLQLSGETLHRVLLGELTLSKAVGSGLIRLRGPFWKMYPLADVLSAGRQFYPQILAEENLQ